MTEKSLVERLMQDEGEAGESIMDWMTRIVAERYEAAAALQTLQAYVNSGRLKIPNARLDYMTRVISHDLYMLLILFEPTLRLNKEQERVTSALVEVGFVRFINERTENGIPRYELTTLGRETLEILRGGIDVAV